ncbi:MAG: carboxypeptidase-like regulatory domain-containing protein [Bacteroidales bacterium]|nr:carboxypeptidase-like regulatory domain-containing protein [Bacteroidales bacterium]
MQLKIKFIAIFSLFLFSTAFAQEKQLVQTIKGIVTDRSSGGPLAFVSVGLTGSTHPGDITDTEGRFTLKNVPVGRYNLQVSSIGYETNIIREIQVTSAKEVFLEIFLRENIQQLGEVVIGETVQKNEPINPMALSGGHRLSVEEASRYAGGMDDPARLVSAFAGVSPSVANNGISVHGNAPHLLQWKLEEVEIPNPNHFADIATLGGGILSSLSSNVLGNSDFFSGAFPAEYNNAVSGVFDMKLRNGNNQKYQHTLQAGLLGLDVASEGPISKKNYSSYIFNYRYSTTGLMNKISPAGDLEQLLDYQDLNFKFHFPTQKAGVFSFWGTGLKDKIKPEIQSPEEWEYADDAKDSRMELISAATGLSHRYFFNPNTTLKTTLATTYSKANVSEDVYDSSMHSAPQLEFKSRYTNFILTSFVNKKYSVNHTNKTGFTLTHMDYDMDLKVAPLNNKPLEQVSDGTGSTNLLFVYTSSLFQVKDRLTATLGVNGQLLTLNKHWTLEPRASLQWKASSRSIWSLAYGLHSRMEKMDVYFVKTKATGERLVNKDLDFIKAHHLNFSYSFKIAEDMNLKVEPYFQYLYDVPVIADSSYSVLNRSTFYVEDALVNTGKGINYGVDITFEKYMTKGFYYMVTASVFDSKYRGGDKAWHNTKFNRRYIVNGLIGKEWMIGNNKQNVLSVNLKLTVQGGDRYSPVDIEKSMSHPDKETQYDESQAFSKQLSPVFLANYSVSYRINRAKVSHEIAVKGLNATGYKEYFGHEYNLKTGVIEPKRLKNSIFNVVYRLDF